MFEQAILSEQFERLLVKQREVAQAYQELLNQIEDPEIRGQLDEICRQKLRDIRMSERLLEIVV
jgi:hypothetical protein